ncbi:MAG: hypothetical protein E4H47_00080 [Parcubacteria group bacterium]|nr:MAG: hypothetical protein E4H47_00080 [Parcubacteria group bacterium]
MYIKIFGYAHNYKDISEFIKWWLRKGGGYWDKDIKKTDSVHGFFSSKDIDRTVLVREEGRLDLIIEKDIIVSDRPRELRKGEMYLNKDSMKGFFATAEKAETWLATRRDFDPKEIDEKKAYEQGIRFDTIGVGFLLETVDRDDWQLHIRAGVVGIPQQ